LTAHSGSSLSSTPISPVPKYPELARQFNIHGKVRIEATVSPNGNLKKTREIGGSPVLVKAVDALKQWKFEDGPKETTEIIEIEFK
jgi:TonB family protein